MSALILPALVGVAIFLLLPARWPTDPKGGEL